MRDYLTEDAGSLTAPARQLRLFEQSTGSLAGLRSEFDELGKLVDRVAKVLPATLGGQITELAEQLAGFATPITFVGQVKAGKTALVNVLAGSPGLLPSDVNPWTSVVTTLHINTRRPRNVRAEFSFFDQTEWEELIHEGGRLGALAKRARADDELTQIRSQIEEMYAKSRERLGRNFELLLGNRHKYDEFNQKLIERYVCLGDQFGEQSQAANQGRFADITRSADLYLDVGGYPMGLSLQDTPGLNDPFLMREQVTLRSVNSASICVVVLSAAQAMNTVDLALIQLLCALESRRVIIFVNRIDELQDPGKEVPAIRTALERVLTDRGIGDISNIIFGSARWAEAALSDDMSLLSSASQAALAALVGVDDGALPGLSSDLAWSFSGVPQLLETIGTTIRATSGEHLMDAALRRMNNLVATVRTRQAASAVSAISQLTEEQTSQKIANLRHAVEGYINKDISALLETLSERVRKSCEDYVERTTRDLVERARENGQAGVEICDPMQLRLRLRTAYVRYSKELRSFYRDISDGIAQAMVDLFGQMLGEAAADMQLQAPGAPTVSPPVALGRTIVVDLQTTRWKAWLAAHINGKGLAREYHSLVEAEVRLISEELIATAEENLNAISSLLRSFLAEQESFAMAIARGGDLSEDLRHHTLMTRQNDYQDLIRDLQQFKLQHEI